MRVEETLVDVLQAVEVVAEVDAVVASGEADVLEEHVVDRVVGRTPDADRLAGAVEHAVRDDDVLADDFTRRLLPRTNRAQGEAVVAVAKGRVADAHAAATVEVNAVSVRDPLVAHDDDPVHRHVLAFAQIHRERRRVLEHGPRDPHVAAAGELHEARTRPRRDAPELRVVPHPLGRIVELRPVAVDRPLARDRYVLRVPRRHERLRGELGRDRADVFGHVVVVLLPRTAADHRALLKVKLHVAAEADRTRLVHARRDRHASAARRRHAVDLRLDPATVGVRRARHRVPRARGRE